MIPIRLAKSSHCLVIALIICGLLLLPAHSAAQGRPQDVVKVLMLPYLDFAPLHIAEVEGYFAEQGIRIERHKFASSDHAVALLLRGDLDVVGSTVRVNLLNAMARDGQIAFVADKGHVPAAGGCAYSSLFARRTWVRNAKEGTLDPAAKVSVSDRPATIIAYATEKAMRALGIADRVERREVGEPAVAIEAVRMGRLDVVALSEPWRSLAMRDPTLAEWMPDLEIIPDQAFALVVYGPRLVVRNPELGQRFMVAYLKAVRQYNQGKTPRNVELVSAFTELDADIVRTACWPAIRGDGSIMADKLVEFEAWAQTKGLLDRIVPVSRFWDGRFVAHANAALASSASGGNRSAGSAKP